MARKKLLVADLLCGAGGSSTGAAHAFAELGLDMELVCVNHWPTAIETHQRNHPNARHYVQDIATVRPHLLVPEGYLDLLMASPTCTHHSVARGGKPTSDQQRSDPWHILTWFTELRVKRAIIENVWEFTSWGPVDPKTGKPIQSRKGEYFNAWVAAIRALGATRIEWRKLNAADYGDATTRQRFIMMIRFDGKPIVWPTPTHASRKSGNVTLFSGLDSWRPARDVIDWSIKGKSIFTRKKPLAAKTLNRIYAGAVNLKWPEPYLVVLRNHMAAQGLDVPLPTIAANGGHIGLAQPVLVNLKKGAEPRDLGSPLPTQTSAASHLALAAPMLLSQHNSGAPRSAEEPLPTITTGGAAAEGHPGCARPILVTVAHGNEAGDATADSRRSLDIDDPLGTIHAGGGKYAMAEPYILNRHGENGGVRAHSIDAPVPTADNRGAGYLVEPFALSRHAEGAARPVDEPLPTQVAKHSHILIAPYYGSGSGETCHSADQPLPTVTAKARFGVVVPLTHAGGAERIVDPDADPLPTITGANRGEYAFITAQHGERDGQEPRTHVLDAPMPTIATSGHTLVEPDAEFDILFRMLEPHELAAAMGLEGYDFAGTKTEQVKQIGNAVSRRKMQACVRALCGDAVPKRRRTPPAMRVAAE